MGSEQLRAQPSPEWIGGERYGRDDACQLLFVGAKIRGCRAVKIVLSLTAIVNVSGLALVRVHDTCEQAEGRGKLSVSPVAERVIMETGGWRTRPLFERYAIVTQSDVADAIGRLQSSRNSDTWGVIDSPKSFYNSGRVTRFLCASGLGRDGGTGRRSGLKIRRASALGGSIPPPGTNVQSVHTQLAG